MWLRVRIARWVPFTSRWLEVAPACCNACRTCTTANIAALLGIVGGVLAAPFVRLGRLARRAG